MEDKKTTKTKEKALKLNPTVWEVPYNADLVAQVLFVYSSNERKGTVKQKDRGEVSGGGKKPWKQKGTGRTRSGSTRSPLWKGGGVTFAAHDRNFEKKINKKMTKKATCVMLSERLRKEELKFVGIDEAKGKELKKSDNIKRLIISNKKEVELSVRNRVGIAFVSPEKLNAKHLVASRNIFVDNDAVKILEERLTNEK